MEILNHAPKQKLTINDIKPGTPFMAYSFGLEDRTSYIRIINHVDSRGFTFNAVRLKDGFMCSFTNDGERYDIEILEGTFTCKA